MTAGGLVAGGVAQQFLVFVDLGFKELLLVGPRHADALEAAVCCDDAVPLAGGDLGGQELAAFFGEVLPGRMAVHKEDGRNGLLVVIGDVEYAGGTGVQMPMKIVIRFEDPIHVTNIGSEQWLMHRLCGRFINVNVIARLQDPSILLTR